MATFMAKWLISQRIRSYDLIALYIPVYYYYHYHHHHHHYYYH